jgi:hypothetical protein
MDDLLNLDPASAAEEGSQMEVRHPSTGQVLRFDDGRPFTITLMGSDSRAVIELATKQQDRRIEAQMRTRKAIPMSVIERDNIELLVVATKGWDLILGGQVPPSKPEEYRKTYIKFRWLREQVQAFCDDRGNFLTA